MAAAAILNFGKMSITSDWIQIGPICTKFGGKMHHDQKSKPELLRATSSNERLERKCVDLSDYIRYLN